MKAQAVILVVDDDEGINRTLALILKRKGYQVAAADSGKAALNLTREQIFDIALVDVRLPDMAGVDLMCQLKEHQPDLEVLLITGHASVESAVEALAQGAYHYFTKPLNMDDVLARISEAIQKQHLVRENRRLYQAMQHELAERKRAEEEILLRNRELALLNEIITASVAGLEQEAILETTCRALAKAFDLPQVIAFLLNEEKTGAVVVAEYRADYQPTALHATFPVQRNSMFQYLLTHLAPLAVEDARNDQQMEPIRDFLNRLGVASVLLVPVCINEEVIGGLGVLAVTLRRFLALELSLAWNVADQVAGSLARQRMVQTHKHLITAVEQSAESVVIADTDGLIIYVNPAFEKVSGYSSAEAIGQELCWLKSGQQDKAFYHDLWLTISSGQTWRGRIVNKKKDGSLFTEEVTISPVRNEAGIIVNYVAVKRDVTRELELEKQYQRVVSSISDHIYMTEVTADGRYLNRYLSPVEKLTGYPQEKFEDWQFWPSTVIHPDDRSFAAGQAARLAAGQDGEIEYRLVRADGKIIWVRDSARVEVEGSSKIIFGVVSDITGRKQAEETLKQRAVQLALLNDIGGQIAAVLDLDGLLDRAAHLVQQTFDYHHVALFLLSGDLKLRAVAGAYRDKFPPGHTQKLNEGINGWVARNGERVVCNDVSREPRFISLISGGEVTRSELCLPIKAAGHVVGVLDIQSPRLNAFTENEVVAMEMFTHQIAVAIENARLYEAVQQELNERTRAEAALAAERASLARRVQERTAELSIANAELAQAARLKDEFLANMSHELRTPLNTILGMAEVLRLNVYGPLTEEQVKALGYIEESGKHLLALINDILDLSKIEAGKLDLQIGVVHVPDVCQASLLFIRQIAQKKEITISSRLDEAVKSVQADERRLKQILVNLLTNAVKFTPQGGQVGLEVTGDPSEGVVHFVVWDTGIGISSEDMKWLFKPFVQIDSSLARQHEGTGLGLSLVYRLAKIHGGSVKLESDGVPGHGSRFTVSLPWRQPEIQETDAGPTLIDIPPGPPAILDAGTPGADSDPLILLAEDNETTIILLRDFLGMNGYRVTVARNGEEAIERAGVERPHLILMDIQMPGMDGLEAIRRIRTDVALAGIPIVALTALAMPGDRERCQQAGAVEYLSKPVRFSRLVEVIQAQIQVGT